ncbi:Alpha/Beta hydrolase protein [Aspergillus carlsbadensis]|nr:Alpha/Beta hydrolase protein [Aspergillus carlsbadensis]
MKHTLSLWNTADAWLGWFSIGAKILSAAVWGPFRGNSGADTYHHHLIQAAVKAVQSTSQAYLFKSYDQLYLEYCKRIGTEPFFVSNDRGLRGFWIGDPTTAKYVVIHFHGGGFAMDATSAYLDFWPTISKNLSDKGITTAWLNVTYTLTPHATYPTQFCEAVESLRYVVEDLGRSPRDVILVGDSAGANLCLALISHISHPSPDVPSLDIAEPLRALVCLSPWVSFRHDWPSMRRNECKDIDAKDVTERWARGYLNGRSTNYYVEACDAPEAWWDGARVEQTLVLAGGDEVLLDPIMGWVAMFSKSNPDTTLVVGQGECHIAPLMWPLFGDRHETQQGAALKSWLSERLRV